MLADDPLGSARERLEEPLPSSYFAAFEILDRDPNVELVVAEAAGGRVVGCLQLCILPGLSSEGASRGLIGDARRFAGVYIVAPFRRPLRVLELI